MPMEYFEQRERALLGDRFDVLYAAPQETAERGVTVSALRSSPEQFAAKADFPLEASPFCKAAFVVHQPDDLKFRPGRHPYHHAGVFYSQEPSASSAAPLLGVQPGMRVLDMCAAPGGKSSQLAAALQGRGVRWCSMRRPPALRMPCRSFLTAFWWTRPVPARECSARSRWPVSSTVKRW